MKDEIDWARKEPRHACVVGSIYIEPGAAIDTVDEDDQGHFIASNGEYASQVNFCPVCGVKAPTPAEPRRKAPLEKR